MKAMLLSSAAALMMAIPAMAQTPAAAPADPAAATAATTPAPVAVPLSTILQKLESAPGFVRFDEVDWKREGYWEIEYLGEGHSETKVRIDAATGEPIAR